MAGPERVHDRIAAFTSAPGRAVGVAARDLAGQASVRGIATELHAHLGEPA
jgi:hypothetical protein